MTKKLQWRRTKKPKPVTAAFVWLMGACFVLAFAHGATRTAWAQETVDIFLPTSPIAWGFYLANEKGYFEEEGIDAQIRVFSSGAQGAEAFQALGADMLEAGDMPALVFAARLDGGAVILGQVAQSEQGIQLIAPNDIRGPADLKGKTIATNLGSTTEYYLTKYLQEHGLEEEVKVINLDPGSQVPALIRGDVDAIVSFLEVGVRALQSDEYHLVEGWGSSLILVATKDFATAQTEAVEGVLRALKRAAVDIANNPEEALAEVSGKHGLIDEAYQNYLSYGGIDLTPQYPPRTHAFLKDVATFLLNQNKLEEPFDFCRYLDLTALREVSPDSVGGADQCN